MPGLNLTAKASFGGAGVSPALPPSYAASSAGATISSRAYGIGSDGDANTGRATAAWGSVGLGVASTLLLVYLWYSLPR